MTNDTGKETSILEDNKIQYLFDSWAQTQRSEQMALGHRHLLAALLQKTLQQTTRKIESVLDIGCGIGDALHLCQEKFQISHKNLKGIDLSSEMIMKAKKTLPSADLHCQSAESLPWEDSSIDLIFSIESLYYHTKLKEGLEEAYRVLRKNGLYLCAIEYFKENLGSKNWDKAINLTLHHLSEQQWKELFEKAGFQTDTKRIHHPNQKELLAKFSGPNSYFPNDHDYADYLKEGALLIIGKKI